MINVSYDLLVILLVKKIKENTSVLGDDLNLRGFAVVSPRLVVFGLVDVDRPVGGLLVFAVEPLCVVAGVVFCG